MEVPSKNYVCTFCRPIVGDEPPEAVLKLAEESRREEAARRAETENEGSSRGRSRGTRQLDSDDTDSDSSASVSSTIIKKRKRSSQNRRNVINDSDDSNSDVVSQRKKTSKRRLLSTSSSSSSFVSSNDEEISLEEVIKKIPLPQGISVDKLLRAKPVVKLEKLSSEKIKSLTSSENEDEEASSAGSSTVFDFNYRVKLNKKQRRKSMVELQSIKEVIRSDTDTLTDASAGQEIVRPNTPAKKSFAKQFKLKLLGSKTVPRKRSTSESDPEHVPAKKCKLILFINL